MLSKHVTVSRHSEGIVLLDSGKGAVFSANATGARLWESLCRGESPRSIATSLSREFAAPAEIIERDAERFLAALVREGILVRERSG